MSPPTFFQFLFSATFLISIVLCNANPSHRCIPTESKALLHFKNNLTDFSNRLASWDAKTDCCSWFGVVCSNITGRVIELHLRSSALPQEDYYNTNPTSTTSYDEYWERSTLGRNISESLLQLEHLQHLDLSNNNFGDYIPEFLGSMSSLRYLNLSKNDFVGSVPRQLGNLSNLEYLVIQPLFEYNPFLLTVENFSWVSHLSSLKFLELRYVGLGKAVDWLESLSKLPLLEQLHLSSCELEISSFSNVSFPSLSVLDLSFNSFYGVQVPGWILNLTSLVDLDLSNNGFSGNIPTALQSLNSLRRLDLSYNQFNSSIPSWSGGFDRLELLDLSINNELEGNIPDSIGNLTSLSVVDLSFNLFVGGIPKSFENLCRLRFLSLSNTEMSQEINEVIEILSGCTSVKLESLDLSNSYFSRRLTNLLGKFEN